MHVYINSMMYDNCAIDYDYMLQWVPAFTTLHVWVFIEIAVYGSTSLPASFHIASRSTSLTASVSLPASHPVSHTHPAPVAPNASPPVLHPASQELGTVRLCRS